MTTNAKVPAIGHADNLASSPVINVTLVNAIDQHIADRHSTLSDDDRLIITLAIIETYFYDCFRAIPYLYVNGPKDSGKTEIGCIVRDLAFKARITYPTVAALSVFRADDYHTAVIDELHRLLNARSTDRDSLMALFNLGYRPGEMWEVAALGKPGQTEKRDPFYPKIFLGNGYNVLDDDTTSRTIQINVTPATVAEQHIRAARQILRPPEVFAPRIKAELIKLATNSVVRQYLARQSRDITPITISDTEEIANREMDIWQPLILIADLISEEHGKRIRSIIAGRVAEPITLNTPAESIDIELRKLMSSKRLTCFGWYGGKKASPLPPGYEGFALADHDFGWKRPPNSIKGKLPEASLMVNAGRLHAELRFLSGEFDQICEAIGWNRSDVITAYRNAGRLLYQNDKNRPRSTKPAAFISGQPRQTLVVIDVSGWLWPSIPELEERLENTEAKTPWD